MVGDAVTLELRPCSVKAARRLVKSWHRHLPDIQGGLFAVCCVAADGECVGVGIAGNPARAWQNHARLVISRCATNGYENACSMIYGALCRAAKALGYAEVWTYTLVDEPGTSLRAAGFVEMGLSTGGANSCKARPRLPAVCPGPKRRWMRALNARGVR